MIHEEYKSVKDSSAVKTGIFNFGRSLLVCFAVTAVIFAAMALILTYTPAPESLIGTAVILAAIVSVVAGAASAARSVKSKGWLTGAVLGILYSIVLYFISSLAGDGFSLNGYSAVIMAVSLFSGAAGGILGINLSDKRKTKR